MKAVPAMAMMLFCAACAAAPHEGVASYDALRDAQAACTAKGGELRLNPGGNPQRLADFACKRK